MSHFIESLESRELLSIVPAVAALKADGATVVADLVALTRVGKANFKLIESDLKADGELKSSAALVRRLGIEGTAADVVLAIGVGRTIPVITAEVNRLEAVARLLAKKPTSVVLQAKFSADSTALTDAANARLSIITEDLTAQHDVNSANVTAVVDANPSNTQLSSDLSEVISPRTTADRTALVNDATKALTTDVSAVISALAEL